MSNQETAGPERKRARILLVEDEPSLVETLTDRLRAEGYEVEALDSGERALERLAEAPFDLLVLDVMLPGMDGFDVLSEMQRRGDSLPVLMLTARSHVADRVVGLKLGADDYLPKPFEMIELLARIQALLRRSRLGAVRAVDSFTFGELRIDFRRAEVSLGGRPVEISALELKLLRYLVEHRGQVVSRAELLEKVWGYDSTPRTRTVDVHVASLRQKLEPEPGQPRFILTVHGLGYRFVG